MSGTPDTACYDYLPRLSAAVGEILILLPLKSSSSSARDSPNYPLAVSGFCCGLRSCGCTFDVCDG